MAQTQSQRDQIVIRLSGELCTKAAHTRRQFTDRLIHNLRDALISSDPGEPLSLRASRNRIFAEVSSPEAAEALRRVFGVQSISICEETAGDQLASIVENGERIFRERVTGRSFAIRPRRVGERGTSPFRSEDVARQLGDALKPYSSGVDLRNPEVEVHVEFNEERAFFFHENKAAPAGLPLGTEGRAVALLSGGFDSPVASWQILKRGVLLDYVFCNMGGSEHQKDVIRVAKVLADRWSYGAKPNFHAVDFEALMRELRENTRQRYWQVLLKRQMLRVAERVAEEQRAIGIVTGEVVGQVSSQTLQNLAVISQATSLPILRPAVGMNKDEIIELARHIGVRDLSANVEEHCAMVPTKPATGAKLEAILEEEAKLDFSLVEEAVAQRTMIPLREFDLSGIDNPDLEIEEIPQDFIVLDLRSKAAYQGWHYPEALHLEFTDALRAYTAFDKGKQYVLVCEIGLKSAHLAELLRGEGFTAFNFKGGLKGLLAYAEQAGKAVTQLASPVDFSRD